MSPDRPSADPEPVAPPGMPPSQPLRRGERVALAVGSTVGGFEILGVVGSGGFSIVYLARDPALDRRVAIKEYLPSQLAERGPDGDVLLREFAQAPLFEQGLDTFMNEARLLARFDHPSLLRVHRFWRERGTAYMAMPYLEGRTLLAARQAMPRPPDEAWLRSVLGALLEAVQTLHDASCFHRDISPDNILLLPSGTPVLLDFGSARTIRGDGTQQLTAVLKPAYAPIEQYAESPRLRQGPWTDLYAWGAVARFCITGRPPPPATVRAVEDLLRPLAAEVHALGRTVPGLRYSPALLTAIDWTLALRPADRPQSVAQLQPLLDGRRGLLPRPVAPAEYRLMGRPPATQPQAARDGLDAAWASTTAQGEAPDEDAAVGSFGPERPAGVPRLAGSARSKHAAPIGVALVFGVLLATAGWRVFDQRETEQSLDLMARSAAAAAGGAGPTGAPLPGGAAAPAIATTRPTTLPQPTPGVAAPPSSAALTVAPQPQPAAAETAAALKSIAAPATLLDGAPEPVPAAAAAERPLEEFLDEPVRDVAAPSRPALRGTPALLDPAQGASPEPTLRDARALRTRVLEPALNDAAPDRPAPRQRAKAGSAAAARDREPRAYCARQDRHTDYFCMKRQCELPRHRKAPDCLALRREGWWGFVRGQWRMASQ